MFFSQGVVTSSLKANRNMNPSGYHVIISAQ